MEINSDSPRQTIIIPVERGYKTYTITVADVLWNEMQTLILEGAIKKKVTIEFVFKSSDRREAHE